MAEPQKNAQQMTAPKTTPAKPDAAKPDALALAQAARQAEAARRAKMTPPQLFREDLGSVTNRIADSIDGQRGALIGVVSRGLQKDALTVQDIEKALGFIEKSIEHVRVTMRKPNQEETRFTL